MNEIINYLPHRKEICLLIKKAFEPSFCKGLIQMTQNDFKTAKTNYPTSYRNNERQIKDDELLSVQLFEKIRHYIPLHVSITGISQEEKGEWILQKLNPRLRICRYLPNQYFNKHLDGIHYESDTVQSKLTFMIYLNGYDDFEGGRTLFFNDKNDDTIISNYIPEEGDLIIFDHNLWHSGETVLKGEKYILRSDILYAKKGKNQVISNAFCGEGHLGYIWTITSFGEQFITSGRDKKIKIWNKNGIKIKELEGHKNSILSLIQLDNNTFVSASRDRNIKIWTVQKDDFVSSPPLKYHSASLLCLCKKDEQSFLSAGADGVINTIHKNGTLLSSFLAHDEWIWEMKFISKNMLVSVGEDGKIKVWNLAKNTKMAEWNGEIPINCLAICNLSQQIFIGRLDGTILCFQFSMRLHSLEQKWIKKCHEGIVRCIKIDENMVVSGGEDNQVKVWSKIDFSKINEFTHLNFVQDILIRKNDIISVSYDGRIIKNIIETKQ